MTRSAMETAVYEKTGKNTSSVDSATQTRIRRFLNDRQRDVLTRPGLQALREASLSFTTVASQSRYAFLGVKNLRQWRDTTNDTPLFPMDPTEYRTLWPDPDVNTGLPTYAVFMGIEPVAKQPANASSLFLKSTSASDTQTAYVEVQITDGYPRALSVSLTGTTAVDLSATLTTGEIVTKFYLASAAVGVVTLHEDSGSGTELARIGIGQTAQRYAIYHLAPQPAGAYVIAVDAELEISDLAQDTDEPRWTQDYHNLLVLGATMDEYEKMADPRWGQAQQRYEQEIATCRYHLAAQRASASVPRGFSRLGAWYPMDTVVVR